MVRVRIEEEGRTIVGARARARARARMFTLDRRDKRALSEIIINL